MAGFDSYERKARLSPGLLAVLPVAVLVVALGFKQYPVIAVITGLLTAAGAPFVLSALVASRGRSAQESLYERWGGRPTNLLLRYSSSELGSLQRDRFRAAVTRVTGVSLLSPADEQANAAAADERIDAAVDSIRRLGQDAAHPIVAHELSTYGLERNLYGMRWIARSLSMVCVLVLAASAIFFARANQGGAIAGVIVDAAILVGWCVVPSEKRTRAAGFRYANQLLLAVLATDRESDSKAK